MSLRAASVSLARFDSYLVPSIFFFLQALPEHQHPCLGGRCPGRPHPGEHRVFFCAFLNCFFLQSLFVNKIQEYAAKKKAADGGMVDANPETQAELQVDCHGDEKFCPLAMNHSCP